MILNFAPKIEIPHKKAILFNVPMTFSFLLLYYQFIVKNILQTIIDVRYHLVGFIIIICGEHAAKVTQITSFKFQITLISWLV